VSRIPGFDAEFSLTADFGCLALRAVLASIEATISPAQSQTSRRDSDGPRRLSYIENSCPPGYSMRFVRNCTLSIPVYDCTWVDSSGYYACHVKEWKCLGYDPGHFECQRIQFRALQGSGAAWPPGKDVDSSFLIRTRILALFLNQEKPGPTRISEAGPTRGLTSVS